MCIVQTVNGPDGFGDVRPLDDEHLRRLRVNCVRLVELVDLHSGLLDDMMSVGCITPQQNRAVKELNLSSADKNRKLIDILTRRSVAHYNLFLDCLRRNSQAFIANFLEGGSGKSNNEVKWSFLTNPCLSIVEPENFFSRLDCYGLAADIHIINTMHHH